MDDQTKSIHEFDFSLICEYFSMLERQGPGECCSEEFYRPQPAAQERFLQKHRGNRVAEDFIANMRHEADLYSQYGEYYGYTFFIGKKR